jgi:selenide,water dikinase
MDDKRLTTLSHGSGCGCKIAPNKLEAILGKAASPTYDNLLVGNTSKDDAAVYRLNETEALISTTDFFMPIVDDPYDFGRISAANALSDVYAMGGQPLLALAILGWPVDKLDEEMAARVMEGGRAVCAEAAIPLAGGHSIDNLEPLFGLAVSGKVEINNLKRNDTAQEGDMLYLTKPLGTGIIATAIKRGLANENEIQAVVQTMTQLNTIGEAFGNINGVTAMTDITGFGLMGHLLEMCEGANLSAELWFDKIPTLPLEMLKPYIDGFVLPDNTFRNYNSFTGKIEPLSGTHLPILCDPQTSGGLLISVNEAERKTVENVLADAGLPTQAIGQISGRKDTFVTVKD